MKYGLRIKKIKAGSQYEVNLGVREFSEYSTAMLPNSLLKDFLMENGLKLTSSNSTRDVICLDFDYGSKSYEEANDKMLNLIQETENKEYKDIDKKEKRLKRLNYLLNNINENKDKFIKKSADDIRIEYYTNGVDIDYPKSINRKAQKIHYVMLYRSTNKAKKGSCIFINEKLYKKARDFIYMGIKLPKRNAPIVEISAYASLVGSSIVDKVKINPKNILILKDIDSAFNTKVISVETNKNKECIANTIENYQIKNTLFDGQALIDESIFPDWGNGFILLRHHMCKMAAFKTKIQVFFKDYYGDQYSEAKIKDMFGNEHYVKDIELITTDNAMKWLKFDITYDYWCDRVYENNCMFGIVKTAHPSKLGEVQRMSYQMINSLDIDIMESVVNRTKTYIESMKRDNKIFLQYLKENENFSNDYVVLVALCEQNWDFTRSEYYRNRKRKIIEAYTKQFKAGKVVQKGDNLTAVGSPYEMLLYTVGEDISESPIFYTEYDAIQCYTKLFDNNENIAAFRNPHNGKYNICHLHNVYNEVFDKYFDLGKRVIVVNCIHTDIQDRANGCDFDSDFFYCTNQKDIVLHARNCYLNYPTIVNNIPKEKNIYDNSPLSFATVDNNLAKAQMSIGESSNLAQIALTYTCNFDIQELEDYVCILSVLAQCAIDNAKRKFDVNIPKEIRRIKKDMDIKDIGYPLFWKAIKKGGNYNINYKLKCPMNYLYKIHIAEIKPSMTTLDMSHYFKKYELMDTRRKSKKVEELIEKFSLNLNSINIKDSELIDNDEYLLLREDFDDMLENIQRTYISCNYIGLMSWLIDRAFCISPQVKGKYDKMNSRTEQNKAILLKTLYTINPNNLLKIFSKNV